MTQTPRLLRGIQQKSPAWKGVPMRKKGGKKNRKPRRCSDYRIGKNENKKAELTKRLSRRRRRAK